MARASARAYLWIMLWFALDLPPTPPPPRPWEVRLQLPPLVLKVPPFPRLGAARNTAVVEVEAPLLEDEDQALRLDLRSRLTRAFKAPPPSTGALDLADFMQENATGGTNYTLRTVRRLVDYWNPPRPPSSPVR